MEKSYNYIILLKNAIKQLKKEKYVIPPRTREQTEQQYIQKLHLIGQKESIRLLALSVNLRNLLSREIIKSVGVLTNKIADLHTCEKRFTVLRSAYIAELETVYKKRLQELKEITELIQRQLISIGGFLASAPFAKASQRKKEVIDVRDLTPEAIAPLIFYAKGEPTALDALEELLMKIEKFYVNLN